MKSVEEAQQYLLSLISVNTRLDRRCIEQAQGSVIAQDIYSNVDVPPYDHSMMDGYALRLIDYSPIKRYKVSQRVPAGILPKDLVPKTVARIFTGAPIPQGADLVIMQEQAIEHENNTVSFNADTLSPGKHVRRQGESVAQGQQILTKGHHLYPSDISLLGSIGQSHVEVFRRLRVVILTTGDELLMPGEPPKEGKIYNANRAMLYALLQQMDVEVIDLGQIKDHLETTIKAFAKAAEMGDLILTTGGVSTGEEDHVKQAIEQQGHVQMWRVDMKPGKPFTLGEIKKTPLLGLPGNPVSAFVAFQLFARPCLLKLQGAQKELPKPLYIEAGFVRPLSTKRREFLRGYLHNEDCKTQVKLYQDQNVGAMRPSEWGQGLIDLPAGTPVQIGDRVAFFPFNPMR